MRQFKVVRKERLSGRAMSSRSAPEYTFWPRKGRQGSIAFELDDWGMSEAQRVSMREF